MSLIDRMAAIPSRQSSTDVGPSTGTNMLVAEITIKMIDEFLVVAEAYSRAYTGRK